jgi:hypothetical protein
VRFHFVFAFPVTLPRGRRGRNFKPIQKRQHNQDAPSHVSAFDDNLSSFFIPTPNIFFQDTRGEMEASNRNKNAKAHVRCV